MSEMNDGWSGKIAGLISGLMAVIGGGLCGAMLGALYVRLFVPRTGMGWDQLADMVGGLMLGGLIGLVGGTILALRLDTRGRLIGSAIAFAVAVLVVFGLRLTSEPRPPSDPVVIEKSYAPSFRISVRVGHTEEVLRQVEPGSEPIPFTEASLWTARPVFEYTGWGPEFLECEAEPEVAELDGFVDLARAASEELAAGSCRTPNGQDLNIPVGVTLEGERASGTIEADCLAERPAVAALIGAIQELSRRLCVTDIVR